MAVELTMPKFGLTMHDGTLQRFFKAPGEAVVAGEPLYEVETEKVLYIVEAPASGTLAAWLHGEGAIVECGNRVAIIAEAGEDPSAIAEGATTSGGRRVVSPVARKLATELMIDLGRVNGTGPGGRITREDVERAVKSGGPASVASGDGAKPQLRTVPMRGMRRTIAARMHQSLRDTAQLTITTEADVTAATELRARLTCEFDFTYTDLLIQAVARALLRHPRMNSRLSEESILLLTEINIGMAVALEEGLIVPVIANAEVRSLREIAIVSKDLGERARSGHLKLEDVSGGTFSITNLGNFGIDAFTPILNSGETGILGVGRIIEKPAVHRGEIARRSMLTLSLTFDHRVIDGAPAAKFLQTIIDIFNYGDR